MARFYYYDQNSFRFFFQIYILKSGPSEVLTTNALIYARKQNVKDSGGRSKMTSSCKWPIAVLWDAKPNLPSTSIRIFFNPPIFLCAFKHCTSTRIRIHSQFVSEFLKRYGKILSPIFFNNCFIDKIVPPSTISPTSLVKPSSSSVRHGKKLQNFEPPFGIIEVYRLNCTHVIRLETWN